MASGPHRQARASILTQFAFRGGGFSGTDAVEPVSLTFLSIRRDQEKILRNFDEIKQIRKQPEYGRNSWYHCGFNLYIWFPIACQKELAGRQLHRHNLHAVMWRLLLIRDLTSSHPFQQ